MKTLRVKLPKSRDPFVNAQLRTLGVDKLGRERFWSSSVNGSQGSTGVVVTEDGECRRYVLGKPSINYCYSAGLEGENALWLSVGLSKVARLDLRTGAYRLFDTGAPGAFVCCGAAFDPDTGKFFSLGSSDPEGATAVAFDTRTKRAAVHRNATPDHYMYACHRLPDGAYAGLVVGPGASLVRWNPKAETLSFVRVVEPGTKSPLLGQSHPRCVTDEQGRIYLSGHGWYDLVMRTFVDTGMPRPEREANWTVRQGRLVLGSETDHLGEATVYAWDLDTGKVRRLTNLPACYAENIALTRRGKIVSLNIYGEFRRHDLESGRLELFRRLPTDAVNFAEHILRLDRGRLIGSYFITQRFWQIDLKTGKGEDLGRAAPGGGQVQNFWKIGQKVYFTSYTTGSLLEYDPSQASRFPENPCVVAEPPHSMRPVAFADDGRNLYYACNAPGSQLGGCVTRYDTRTGLAIHRVSPIPDQAVWSMWLDRRRGELLAHTSFRSDANACPPTSEITWHLRLRAEDLSVVEKIPLPPTNHASGILGPLDDKRLLGIYWYAEAGQERKPYLGTAEIGRFLPPETRVLRPRPADWIGVHYAGRPGLFVVRRPDRVELWNLRDDWKCVGLLRKDSGVHGVYVQGHSVYLLRARDVMILEDVL